MNDEDFKRIREECAMQFCKRKAVWKAIRIDREKFKGDSQYCNVCKRTHQEGNSAWKGFEKI